MNIRNILRWHALLDRGDSNATEESTLDHTRGGLLQNLEADPSRRRFIRTAAGAAGATGLLLGSGLSVPVRAGREDDDARRDDRDGDADDPTSPLPIPGGTILPFSTERYHFFFPPAPGNPGGAEPSAITDFRGLIGLSHVTGTGTGINTNTGVSSRFFYDMDVRFMKGTYLDMCSHEEHLGAFAFI